MFVMDTHRTRPSRSRARGAGARLTSTAAAAAALLLATALPGTASAAPAAPQASPDRRAAAVARAENAVAVRAASLGFGARQELVVKDVIVDADGSEHVRFDRTYADLPVLGGDFVVHLSPGGAFEGADRASRAKMSVPALTPAVTRSKALGLAEDLLRSVERTVTSPGADARLVIDALGGRTPRLAWHTEVTAKDARGNPVGREVLVDAGTGRRLDSWDSVHAATGSGRSLYSGTVPLETTGSGGSYSLKDPTRGDTYTGDAANKTDLCVLILCLIRAPATVLTDADNAWGTGAASDRASAAVDAQYGTDMTWDYFEDVHGRLGIAGDGKGSYNRVHYGSDYNNAFWDDTCFCMTYGDGDGTTFGPLVSLDVAGHEMSHGVTSSTANLTYSGESGGLNEATSDIFGSLVEFHAGNASDPGDYLIGEKVVKPGFGDTALRFMDRPNRDGSSAACWTSTTKDLDVHHSSGVANHFAYLLAEGTGTRTIGGLEHSGTTCDGSSLTGIGRDKLGAIWYRALTVHMTSSTTYAGARTATLAAAADLYGAGSAERDAVAAAWAAVDVR
jgi:Zn-dependent metalloprotease